MGHGLLVVTIVIVVITILVPSLRAELGSGSASQKVRRYTSKFWRDNDDTSLSDEQLRQFLATSLTNSYSLGQKSADSSLQGKQTKPEYHYGGRVASAADPARDVMLGDEATPPQRANKRNGFFYGKRNGFFYGKRSGSSPANTNKCTKCGPQSRGQCVMFGICCSYEFGGCFLLTEEALPCMVIPSPHCELSGQPCGTDGFGRCVTDSICCSPKEGACRVDTACSESNF